MPRSFLGNSWPEKWHKNDPSTNIEDVINHRYVLRSGSFNLSKSIPNAIIFFRQKGKGGGKCTSLPYLDNHSNMRAVRTFMPAKCRPALHQLHQYVLVNIPLKFWEVTMIYQKS